MNRLAAIKKIRARLRDGHCSLGSWMQLSDSSVAEIMGASNFDWVAVDLEHGNISFEQLPNIFRALELGDTLPMARIAEGKGYDCKKVLDAGAAGVIVPMVEDAGHLISVRDSCCWPPSGNRGVAFSRANLFGKRFDSYQIESQEPLLVAMIENINALINLDEILAVKGLDAVLIGPYDLSASLGSAGDFENPKFLSAIGKILSCAKKQGIAAGVHVVEPCPNTLKSRIEEGYSFLAYSIDTVMLRRVVEEDLSFVLN